MPAGSLPTFLLLSILCRSSRSARLRDSQYSLWAYRLKHRPRHRHCQSAVLVRTTTFSRLHVRDTLARNGNICAPRRWTRSRFETARAERTLAYCEVKTPLWVTLWASSAVPPSPCVEERNAVLYELFVCLLATAGKIVVLTEYHRALAVTTLSSCMECHVKILCNVGVISEASFTIRGSGAS